MPAGSNDRAAIYIRVSSSQQEVDGTSLESQEAACNAYARERGYSVVGIYSDTYSGAYYRERPGLTEMRALIASGGLDVVIVYALDRLSRDQLHTAVILDEIEHHGARLDLVTEEFEDSVTGKFIRSVKAFAAELEREKITERTQRGRKARVQSGKPLASYQPLYGYMWADEEKSRYLIDPDTGPVVRRVFREFASGRNLRQIALGLTRDGIPTPGGKSRWFHTTVRNIVRHPNYTGEAYGWAWEKPPNGGMSQMNLDRAILLPAGTVPPLVDMATWQACQERLRENRKRQLRHTRHNQDAMLRGGLVVCGHCGYNLTTQYDDGQLHYRCTSRYRHRTDCTTHRAPAAELDAAAWAEVHRFFEDMEMARDLAADRRDAPPSNQLEIEEIRRSIAATERRQQNLIRQMAGFDDPDAAAAVREQIAAYSQQLRNQHAELDALTVHEDRRVAEIASRRAWIEQARIIAGNLDELDTDERRELVRALNIRVRLFRREHSKAPPVYTVDPPSM